jgi:ABC-type sugar transport system substrate-binding protein
MKTAIKSTIITLSTVLALAAAGCGSTEESAASTSAQSSSAADSSAAEPVKATFVGVMQGGFAWGRAEQGFTDACAELGWDGQYVAPSTANDTAGMVELAETAITNGAEVLIGTFYDVDIFGDVLKSAKDNGTYIATTNCYLDSEHEDFWIGTDPTNMGKSQAEALVSIVGDAECTVVYMQTNATTETQNQQFEAFQEYLTDYSNITVFGQQYCNSDQVTASDLINNLVKANPEINAVVCADGAASLGLGNFVDENGNADSFYAVGIDDGADVLNYVLSDALDCTIAQNFYQMGYQSVYLINDLMNGKEVAFDNDSGTTTITKDNAQSYADENGIALS